MQFLFFNAIGVSLTKKMKNERWMQELPERNEEVYVFILPRVNRCDEAIEKQEVLQS